MSRQMVCSICGSDFTCGLPGNCWCSSVRISREKSEMLSRVASDCVCSDCLTK